MKKMPKVGMGVIVLKDKKVLLLQRKNAHGEGTWCFPGGHLEFNEELENCAKREVFEETGIYVKNIKFVGITNDIFREEGKHYIAIFMASDWESGEARITEPKKCINIGWFESDKLPEPLFLPIQSFIKQGNNPLLNFSIKQGNNE